MWVHASSLISVVGLVAVLLPSLHAAEPVAVHATGRALVLNGVDTLSPGLFGVHYCQIPSERWAELGITGLRVIHNQPSVPDPVLRPGASAPGGVPHVVTCFFDRYRPAFVLSEPKTWERMLRDLGRAYGERIADLGPHAHVEFWNEPYLNWSTKPGVNLDARYYDTTDAVAGGPVRIRGIDEPTEHLVWRRGLYWIPDDPTTTQLWETYVAVGNGWGSRGVGRLKAGETWEYRGKQHRVIEAWVPWDTSWEERPANQRWYSARQFGLWYDQMLRAFGEGLRETAPQAQFIAGWGFHLHQGDGQRSWIPWDSLFKPTIDRGIDLIDGIHEHHYGGDTRVVAAAYETVNAYSTVTHGKALACYNTEAGANFDPQRPDAQRNGTERWFARFGSPQRQKAMMAYHYLVRDIVYLASRLPDKAQARAAHASHETQGGDALGFRQLRSLRGRLIACEGGDESLWAVSTRPAVDQLTVVVWNDRTEERTAELRVTAPAGWQVTSGVIERVVAGADGEQPALVAETIDASPRSEVIPPRQAITLHYQLTRLPDVTDAPVLQRDQRHGDRILVDVAAGTSETLMVHLDEALCRDVTRAWVQVAVTNNLDGHVDCTVGDHAVALPQGQWLLRAEIPVAALATEVPVRFTAATTGYSVWSASIVVERELAADPVHPR